MSLWFWRDSRQTKSDVSRWWVRLVPKFGNESTDGWVGSGWSQSTATYTTDSTGPWLGWVQRLSRLQRRRFFGDFRLCRFGVRAIRTGNPYGSDGNFRLRTNFTRLAVSINGFRYTDTLFHFLAGLEGYDVFRRDFDRFAGSWVPRYAGLPLADFKHSEFPKFDAAIGRQRIDDRIEGPLHDFLRFDLGELCQLRDPFYDFFFCHEYRPPDDCETNAIPRD